MSPSETPRAPFRNPLRPIRKVTERHKRMAECKAIGMKEREIKELFGAQEWELANLKRTKGWLEYLEECCTKARDQILSGVVPVALRRAQDIIEDGDDSEANKAIKTILDKVYRDDQPAGVVPTINISVGTAARLEAIEAQVQERQRAQLPGPETPSEAG